MSLEIETHGIHWCASRNKETDLVKMIRFGCHWSQHGRSASFIEAMSCCKATSLNNDVARITVTLPVI
jgi:hypothetical protein